MTPLARRAQKEREARHGGEVPYPRRVSLASTGPTVVRSRFQSEGHPVFDEEDPLAEPAVDRIQFGGVWCRRAEVEPGITAQDVRAATADNQARASEYGCGLPNAAGR